METRWSSFENINAEKGKGGLENKGAKGHPCGQISKGESVVLLYAEGPGRITRMWFTINDRSPEMLRSLKIEMFWDGSEKPAVSAPFGDFFGVGPGQNTAFENELFANPEGESFNCFIPMPFKKSARIIVTNEGKKDLLMLFYDINFIKSENWNDEDLYFHCYWHRDTATTLTKDFEILPEINGKGRFLGSFINMNASPAYKKDWWGEGEVKMYLDGDTDYPTLVGTGAEDYVGTGWGLDKFVTRYSGCLISDRENQRWAFYRYHIPDPVYFTSDFKATIQQIGGNSRENVMAMINEGLNLLPITFRDFNASRFTMYHLLDSANTINISNPDLVGHVNYYRSDDYASTAYFYLNRPENNLSMIQPIEIRIYKL
ncbi:MAG: hypothetical protein A2W90_22460 [Bacteroidetes bacterium GWF2_42_66]|nr:MAG: hypothetical protein A2W92_21865 [Bacteroidetes bacterium GWA2_42_15]OFY03146.1 MAG: hypothetical protein A2W89_13240 [Bacteroidetes bacterium GWE2_42_39]OFY45254.1 MAG: hypothetical protein A2W90_22460 [Bacteroidetes bacterium GWF2_42_66]